MGLIEILLIAIGLAMDAFAVSICKGLQMKKTSPRDALTVGLWFGAFQALMPLIGYFLGTRFEKYIEAYDHWIALALLSLIGINMIREAFEHDANEEACASVSAKSMLLPAIATSIDALAVGIAFAVVESGSGIGIALSVALIGIITLIISAVGVKIGSVFGSKFKKASELTGGLILIIIGVKIVLEHLGYLNF